MTPTGPGRGVRLGIDVGSVRVGVARSDPDGVLATPVTTLARGDDDPGPDVAAIAGYVTELAVVEVVVGLPRSLAGAEGAAASAARAYADHVARAVHPVPVRLVDERFTTRDAHQRLHAAGRPGRRHRSVVDQVAAVSILQAALDADRRGLRTSAGQVAGAPVTRVDPAPDERGRA